MKKIIVCMHVSLDGFVAGPNGEMDWINLDDEMFDLVGNFTNEADTAMYGRVTYEMMDSYWPTAAEQPNATKHDIEHSDWYNKVEKIVLSKTMKGTRKDKTTFIGDNIETEIQKLKSQPGNNIMIFGSPRVVHTLIQFNLIDEYWLFVNPVLLGEGIPMFTKANDRIQLQLTETKMFSCGVAALHHIIKK